MRGGVSIVRLLPSASQPRRQSSRTRLVVRTPRTWGWGRALVWVASTGPSLARSFHPSTSREPPFHRSWRRGRRAPVLEWQAPSRGGRAAATNAVLAAQGGAAFRDRAPSGGAAPRPEEDRSWALIRANKARNLWCQRPREPGYHQVAGRAGARAITSFPHSTEPSPDPARKTKDSPRFPTVSAEPILPPPKPKPGAGLQQRSPTRPLSAPEGSTPFRAFAPGPGASGNPTLTGHLCSLLAPK